MSMAYEPIIEQLTLAKAELGKKLRDAESAVERLTRERDEYRDSSCAWCEQAKAASDYFEGLEALHSMEQELRLTSESALAAARAAVERLTREASLRGIEADANRKEALAARAEAGALRSALADLSWGEGDTECWCVDGPKKEHDADCVAAARALAAGKK